MAGDPRRAFISLHALQRCSEMGITRSEVVATLVRPATTYPSSEHYGPNRRVSVSGRIAVVHTADHDVVITVLWNGADSRSAGPLAA